MINDYLIAEKAGLKTVRLLERKYSRLSVRPSERVHVVVTIVCVTQIMFSIPQTMVFLKEKMFMASQNIVQVSQKMFLTARTIFLAPQKMV